MYENANGELVLDASDRARLRSLLTELHDELEEELRAKYFGGGSVPLPGQRRRWTREKAPLEDATAFLRAMTGPFSGGGQP